MRVGASGLDEDVCMPWRIRRDGVVVRAKLDAASRDLGDERIRICILARAIV
jgi:hypothetical protein